MNRGIRRPSDGRETTCDVDKRGVRGRRSKRLMADFWRVLTIGAQRAVGILKRSAVIAVIPAEGGNVHRRRSHSAKREHARVGTFNEHGRLPMSASIETAVMQQPMRSAPVAPERPCERVS